MQVNVNATFMLTQALLPLLLKASSPSLVFTGSSVGRVGRAKWGAYAVSKFATEGLMQVLADKYRNQHLRVNCINPGGTRTPMRASAFPDEDPLRLKTTAAFGTATRAHGLRGGVIQFIKGEWPNGERNLLADRGVEFQVMATGFTWDTQDRTGDTLAAQAVCQHGKRMLSNATLIWCPG